MLRTGNTIDIQNNIGTVEATSQAEAIGKVIQLLENTYPSHNGWQHHVTVFHLTVEYLQNLLPRNLLTQLQEHRSEE